MSSGPVFDWLNELFHAETKMTIAFLIASQIHAKKVQKEFKLLRESVDHVAAGLVSFRTVADEHERRITALEQKERERQ